jgi:hypothetical protein
MKIFAVLLLASISCFAQDADRTPASAPATCVATYFTGDVKHALPFVQTIGSGLTYRLVPSSQKGSTSSQPPTFNGWTIQIAYLEQRGAMEREFSEIMTPPYRQAGPRQLDTSYERSIANVLKADHTVYFPLDMLDFAEASKNVNRILWRSSPPEVQEAARDLQRISVGSAKLNILGQQLTGDPAAPTSIQMLSFKVELVVPSTVKLTPELAGRSKPSPCPVSPLIPLLKEMQK